MSDRAMFVVVMPEGVVIDDSVFGTTWPVLGAPAECHVVLPDHPAEADPDFFPHWELRRPPVNDADQALAWFEKNHVDPRPIWGRGLEGAWQTEVTVAWVSRAVALVADDSTKQGEAWREFAEATGRAIDGWVEHVTEWLEVLALVDVRRHRDTPASWERHVYPKPLRQGSDGQWTGKGGVILTQPPITYMESRASLLEDWRNAVAHANAGEVPPDEHRFLRDARAAIRRRDPRRAVIDAATAAEVALSRAVRTRLAVNSPSDDEVENVLRRASGAVELYDLLRVLGGAQAVSRGRLADRLAGKRNSAAHAGRPPTWDEAQSAVAVATELVNAETPIE
jgi:hypothetical protein